ncbi:hypothetical protein A3F00_02350 [Candidatus Daviesbacteria bacterium RIFCSPHIGHO2_12_FULL_37_11]|uniref:Tetratricopeptide repeat protein n=1 Tax=Candidatus Daviesbacteria bacterium RIFCSPHIGHO2_12_FULL_37_11 TaxID=1797777 RepID=A0A1F5K8E7_9BACT|nr:MAG: hypothetical protein A2769_00195 [Candidatus Daviesbacteria bacterium RIFCSPHIGHO2_01_FULL_37_27]OGE37223.1 MAG: hypothetical protein A3F00_02350 [Candidatus Daviesbacteria bacterium RIFCSPHIGHO2_12_FULL_37_11]OGE46096.1 MAG: hypothetical protein A3B39_00805 [Candidatus Daviesbacteria bacterium RIFCSPLOWO2_01_FULL_37_10]
MEIFSEAKANFGYFVARNILERLAPKVNLKYKDSVTLETAKEFEVNNSSFDELADIYYSVVLFNHRNAEEAIESTINLSQQLINLGDFRSSKYYLSKFVPRYLSGIDSYRQYYYLARREEKFAWIADYEIGYKDELNHLSSAKKFLENIPHDLWRNEERSLDSTIMHFAGRAYFGLDNQGFHRGGYIHNAVGYFNYDLEKYRDLRENGNPNPAGEGFNHAWLARCYMNLEDWNTSLRELDTAGVLFDEVSESSKSGLRAHFNFLKGLYELRSANGSVGESIHYFSEAARIWEDLARYPFGAASAHLGLAKTYWKWHKPIDAVRHLKVSVQTNPYVLLRGVPGG